MKTEELLLLAIGAGAAYYVFFTPEGSEIVEQLSDATGIEFQKEYHYEGKRTERRPVRTSDDIYLPINDLYIPSNYYKFRYLIDENMIPSRDFWDWYQKGSGLKYEDYYYPPHYWYNPDYYIYNGNQYKRWYPNIYDISSKPTNRVPYWFGEVYY